MRGVLSLNYAVIILIGYLFGNIQSAYILGRVFKKVDIRELGFGNSGASNAAVSFGWSWGVAVALFDIAKAVLSVMIVRSLMATGFVEQGYFPMYLNGAAVILGHDFPFFMKFKGGKGTASYAGMLLGIDPLLGLAGILLTTLVTVVTDHIAIGTLVLTTSALMCSVVLGHGLPSVLIMFLLWCISTWKHIPNIKRIMAGTEHGLRHAINKHKKK
jgi:glycerol-3-phosphate acyltransferase PlsY